MPDNEKIDPNAVPEPITVRRLKVNKPEVEMVGDAKEASALTGEAERVANAPVAPFKVETTDLGHDGPF